jgi:hypothetical protein
MTGFDSLENGTVSSSALMNRQMHRKIRSVFGVLVGAAVLAVFSTFGSPMALAQFAGPVPLNLVNGWTNAPFSTSRATVELVSALVQLRGAIATTGTNSVPFTLPVGFRPLTDVFVPLDLCNATKGRIHITPSGVADIEAEGGIFSNAQCFTSLDGASFAPKATHFTSLTLMNGWVNAPFSTSNAAVQNINGIVHFKGAISSGTTTTAFVLPVGFRPATNVFIPVDMCNSANGRLNIQPSGVVDVEAENAFSDAQCFTSLDGAWFAASTNGFRPLTPINGWVNAPFSTSNAAATNSYGLVYFKGAISTAGTNSQAFVLPVGFRPVTDVYIPLDLCNATNGRLHIQTNGAAIVEAAVFSNAQCFTSLDGASYVQ